MSTTTLLQPRSNELTQIDECIAKELGRVKNDKISDQKIREKLRKECPELVELQSKIRQAYIAREQMSQMADKRMYAERLAKEEVHYGQQVSNDVEAYERELKQLEAERRVSQVKIKAQLDRQMQEQQETKLEAEKVALKEKQMVDDIVARIRKEDEDAIMAKQELKTRSFQEIAQFQAERKAYNERMRERLRQEEEAIRAYAARKDEQKAAAGEKMKARQRAIEKLQERLGEQLLKRDKEITELEQVRQTLILEEQAAKHREAQRISFEKRLQSQKILRDDYEKQIKLKEECLQNARNEEENLRKLLQAKFEEDEKKERQEAAKQRAIKQEYAAIAREAREQKQRYLEAELEKTRLELERARQRMETERKMVEEERERILKANAAEIAEYLPRGVFRSKEERDRMVGKKVLEKERYH